MHTQPHIDSLLPQGGSRTHVDVVSCRLRNVCKCLATYVRLVLACHKMEASHASEAVNEVLTVPHALADLCLPSLDLWDQLEEGVHNGLRLVDRYVELN